MVGIMAVNVQFRAGLSAGQIEHAEDRLEKNIRNVHPEIKLIFIEAESISGNAKT